MSVRITGYTTSKTGTQLTHEDSGAVIETVAPKDNGGDGSRFSPTDLCATSLGSCGITIMNMFAHNHDIPVSRIAFSVEKEMAANPRRISRLQVRYEITTTCSEADFKKIVAAGKACPIRQSLHPDLVLDESFIRTDG